MSKQSVPSTKHRTPAVPAPLAPPTEAPEGYRFLGTVRNPGRRMILRAMGLQSWNLPAASRLDSGGYQQRLEEMAPGDLEFELYAQAWLLCQADNDLLPGASVRDAINDGTWTRFFDVWMLQMDEAAETAIGQQYAAASATLAA